MGILDLFRTKKKKRLRPRSDPHVANFQQHVMRRIIVQYSFDNPDQLRLFSRRLGYDTKAAIVAGLEAWHRANPQLVFARSPSRARLRIRFKSLPSDEAGCAQLGTFPNGTIWVDLSKNYSFATLRDTVAHEFGHICGYGHANDIDHLMFGEERNRYRFRGNRTRKFKVPYKLV